MSSAPAESLQLQRNLLPPGNLQSRKGLTLASRASTPGTLSSLGTKAKDQHMWHGQACVTGLAVREAHSFSQQDWLKPALAKP